MTEVILQPGPPADAGGRENYITAREANKNFGLDDTVNVGKDALDGLQRGLVWIDVSSIPAGSTIDSAVLEMYIETGSTLTAIDQHIHRCLTEWQEGALNGGILSIGSASGSTWQYRKGSDSSAWGVVGGQSGVDYAAVATASTGAVTRDLWVSWNVAADLNHWVTDENTNLGWFIISDDETTNARQKTYTSRDDLTNPSERPKLTVNYTEVASGGIGSPSNVMLLNCLLGGGKRSERRR